MKKSFLLASITAMIMSSCSNNEFDFAGNDAGSKLQVSASIHEMQTRAHDTSWDAKDAIGVSDDGNNANVKYETTNGDGVFSSTETIYILGDENHNFTAYYPYSTDVTADNKVISFSKPVDFMYGTATATRQNPNAAFTFSHKMSELSFTVTDASTGTNSAAKTWTRAEGGTSTITLHNVILDGTFDTSTGMVTPGSTKGDITINFTPNTKASFILPTQTFTNNSVEVSVNHNGKTYGGTLSLEKTEESKDIQYSLTINKENQKAAVAFSSSTITGWTPVDKGNQDLDEKEPVNVLEIGDFLLNDGSVVDKTYNLTKVTEAGKKVVGVVYYVGNAQPSSVYTDTYSEAQDILKTEAPKATNGLAIAINNANEGNVARLFSSVKFDYSTWFTDNEVSNSYIKKTISTTTPGSEILGYNNTAIIEKVGESYNEAQTGSSEFMTILTAFRTANEVSSNCSKWYLPSYAELKQIQDNYATIEASIEKVNGTLVQFSDFTPGTKDPTDTTEKFYWSSDLRGGQYGWVSPLVETAADEKNLYITRNSNNYKGYFRFAIAF